MAAVKDSERGKVESTGDLHSVTQMLAWRFVFALFGPLFHLFL